MKRPGAVKAPGASQLPPKAEPVTGGWWLPHLPLSPAMTHHMAKKVPLAEVCIERMKIKNAMAGSIILEVPGDQERDKASALTARLALALNPATVKVAAPTRTAELRVDWDRHLGRQGVASEHPGGGGEGCRALEVRVGDIRISRGGLGSV
jgi:hypothetical protein